jgi:cysteinyl-tRNA synthetase
VMANYWMHNGFLQVEGEKMSKSLGNFVTIHELLHTETFGGRKWPGEVLRLAMLRTHYRQPIDWTVKALEEAEKTLDRWYALYAKVDLDKDLEPDSGFLARLSDDLNTPAAIADLFSLFASDARDPRRNIEGTPNPADDQWIGHAVASAQLLGLLQKTPEAWERLKFEDAGVNEFEIDALITARLAARTAKNWAESDRIRDALAAMGVALKDNKDGTTSWEVKR